MALCEDLGFLRSPLVGVSPTPAVVRDVIVCWLALRTTGASGRTLVDGRRDGTPLAEQRNSNWESSMSTSVPLLPA